MRARRRRLVAAALLAAAVAFGAVLFFSDGGRGASPGSSPRQLSEASARPGGSAASKEITVDGVTIYTTNPGGGAALYSFEPFAPGDPALSQETASHATTGDLMGCELRAERPGRVGKGCALLITQVQAGDLQPKAGPPQTVYSVCGRPPGPGEIAGCKGTVTDRDIDASLRELRRALK